MNIRSVAIIGGTGFIGTHLASRLARDRLRITVVTRSREAHRHLLVLPTAQLVEADVQDPQSLVRVLAGHDAVVNLAGILNESGDDGRGFRRVHVELTERLVAACRTLGIPRYLHMSALGAAVDGPSFYQRTKGEAEQYVHAAAGPGLLVTSFRPSVVFGQGDGFYGRFAALLAAVPFVFPLACATTRFQPVWVEDVVEAFARALADRTTADRRYDLCGPQVYTLREVVEYTARTLGLRRRVIPLSERLARLQAEVFERLPGKPFSRDNLRSASQDSICRGECGLAALGIVPTAVEAIVPGCLRGGPRARYQDYRRQAGRG